MRVVRVRQHGGPEVLRFEEAPLPEPGPGEVRVRVTQVGLNHLDVWVRRGVPGHAFPLPLIPGADIAGIREDTGAPVVVHPAVSCMACARCLEGRHDLCRSYRIRGERTDGGCAEALCVPAWQLLPADGLDPAEAACAPLALLTAWHAVVTRAGVRPGMRVVVQGGAGGVGAFAIQVAKLCGARVAATASTEAKRALCLSLGAEEAWPYDRAVAGCKAWTAREGADLVIDHAGPPTWDSSLAMARWGGAIATFGATGGATVAQDLRVVFFKQLTILGSTMGSLSELAAAWDALRGGRIRPVLDRVLPMTRLADAYALLEERQVSGKIVVAQDLAAG